MSRHHARAEAPTLECLEPRQMLSAASYEAAFLSFLLAHPSVAAQYAAKYPAYSFLVGAKPGGGGTTVTDDYGNTLAAASPVMLSSSGTGRISGAINYAGDVDVFSVVAPATGTMQITLSGSGKTGAIPALAADNSSGSTLVSSYGSSRSKTAQATISVTAGQTYYLRAAGYGGSTGAYTLGITTTVAPAPAPSPSPSPSGAPLPSFLPGLADYVAGTAVAAQVVNTTSGQVLVILSTAGSDSVTVSQSGAQVTVTTAQGSTSYAGAFAGIALYGFGGDDVLRFTYSTTSPHVIYGGDGNDQIFDNAQGMGWDYGVAGNDLIATVGGGSNTVSGGTGLVSFWVDSSDAITDVSSAETAAKSVHTISQFYQPYTQDTSSASYVSLNINGQNLTDPAASYAYQSFAAKPLFTDGPDYRDVAQGQVGDCYFMAALASIANTDPGIIRQAIAPLGDGTYVVQYFRNGAANFVRVDADLPASGSSLAYAKTGPDGELWVPLMEKAYAYFRSGANSYASLASGVPETVFGQVAGVASAFPGSMSISTAWSFLSTQLSAGHPLAACSTSVASGPIVASHAYTVMSVQIVGSTQYVTVYNPWGFDGGTATDANSGDGLVTLTISQFVQYFAGVAAGMM